MKFLIGTIAATLINISIASAADIPALNNITEDNFDTIIKEFSANQNFYTVSPASSLGKIFGAEFGVVAGVTQTPGIDKIVRDISPTAKSVNRFPHASLLGRFSVPYGITGEVQYFPKKTVSSVTYQQTGGSLAWTITDDVLTDLPFTLAFKGYYTTSKLSFGTKINNSTTLNQDVNVTASVDDKIWGAQAVVSKLFFDFMEPYLSFGYTKAKGTFGVDGSATIVGTGVYSFFNQSFTSSSSATKRPSSALFLAGFNAQAAFFVLGAEYARAFAANTYNAKISFRF